MKVRKFCSKLLMIFGLVMAIGLLSPQMEVSAKTTTITVEKVDQKTAKKVHKQLMKGKAFNLRFKITVKSPDPAVRQKSIRPKCEKLMKKVAKCTDYDFNLYPILYDVSSRGCIKEEGRYLTYAIKKWHCQEYIYGVKFAKRQHNEFKAYISKALNESERIHEGLLANTIIPADGCNNQEELIPTTEATIASLKDLSNYLEETKFRDLSESMKARILLEVGYIYNRPWGDCSMCYNEEDRSRSNTFKALYLRKAYGRCSAFAAVTCKTCAVFGIGDYDYGCGEISGGLHAVAWIKLKNRNGKTRYCIVSNGVYDRYNDFVGYKFFNHPSNYRTRPNKIKSIKKINGKTQQLKPIGPSRRVNEVYDTLTGENLITYHLDAPKSEW